MQKLEFSDTLNIDIELKNTSCMVDSPYSRYMSTSINSANEAQQIILLFDEVLKILYKARKCAEAGDIEGKYKSLEKTIQIFMAMQAGITSLENEVIRTLNNFYSLNIDRLYTLNIKSSSLDEYDTVINGIRKIRDTMAAALEREESGITYQ